MELHHLAIGASAVDKIAIFYKNVFSLKERMRHFEGEDLRSVWLELGSGILMIESVEKISNVWGKEMRHGLFLIAFRVSPEERKRVERKIKEEGGRVENLTEFTTYGRDPENNRIAISTHPLT